MTKPVVKMRRGRPEITHIVCLTCGEELRDPKDFRPQWARQHAMSNPGHKVAVDRECPTYYEAAK